jgi:hypothetical protein
MFASVVDDVATNGRKQQKDGMLIIRLIRGMRASTVIN